MKKILSILNKNVTSYRRHLLDRLLEDHQYLMRGLVFDIGGKKKNPRGNFRPPLRLDTRWMYVNTEPAVNPDILADAHHLPLISNMADCMMCCEVLEHVRQPELCISEMLRVLKPGGTLMFSVPFLFPIHADPDDFGRFTPQGIMALLPANCGVQIIPMGAWLGTVGMFLEFGARKLEGTGTMKLLRVLLVRIGRFLAYLETLGFAAGSGLQAFSTGYFCLVRKSPATDGGEGS